VPLVKVEEVIPAPAADAWNLILDIEAYPHLMEHVHSVRILEQGLGYRVSEWEVNLKGCAMHWVEREETNEEKLRIDYRQIKGEMAAFEGYWQLEPLNDCTTKVTLTVQFDIGIPLMSDMLNPVAERALQDNSLRMLRSLASQFNDSAIQKVPTPHPV
jgi:ribosome-associated toxin RatA of RatAB toxin-antitoxin module